MVSGTRVPGRDKTTFLGAGLVRGGALIVRMVNGKTPAANLPQRTIVLIMVRGLFVAVKAVRIRGRGLFVFALGAREGANATFTDCTALHAISTFSWGPFTLRWTLSCEDAGDEVSGRGRWSSRHEMILNPRSRPTMDQVSFHKDHLAICFTLLRIQFHPLTFDLFLFGNLGSQGVDVSDDTRVNEAHKSVVDEETIN